MELKPELIRNILLDVEQQPAGEVIGGFQYDDFSKDEVLWHVKLLLDEGYLDGKIANGHNGMPKLIAIKGMTMSGYKFLENAKNNTLWKKIQAEAAKRGGSMTMVIANSLLAKAAEKYLGLELEE